ncbi:glycosyltransferase [Candidatus Gracilibacteria bacterium]|nr:glycosyltransferase [Candidatus Gracilibacteria bacterium]
MKTKKKILLFHDIFLMKGGAERMNIEIAKILDADIATAYWSPDCYDAKSMGFQGKIIQVDPNFKKGGLGFLKMKWRFFHSKKTLKDYDIVFFSNEAISAIWGLSKHQKSFYYAHSISRHLFDLYDEYLAKVSKIRKIPYIILAFFLKKLYLAEIKKVDTIFVNSKANQKRVEKWLGRNDAKILYPPVDTDKFFPKKDNAIFRNIFPDFPESYFLSFSRLTFAKRVDEIIKAFKNLPSKNLVVLFGAEDSQREKFMQLAKIKPTKQKGKLLQSEKYPNIFFYSLKDNNLLVDIIQNATASIAISKNEDFGMITIESAACGTSVIAVNEGGYKETIKVGKNGLFLPENLPIQEGIEKVILETSNEEFSNIAKNCNKSIEEFSLKNFEKKLRGFIKN